MIINSSVDSIQNGWIIEKKQVARTMDDEDFHRSIIPQQNCLWWFDWILFYQSEKRFHLLLDLRLDWLKPNPRVTLSSLPVRLEALTTRKEQRERKSILLPLLFTGNRWRHEALFSLFIHWFSQLNWLKSELSAKTRTNHKTSPPGQCDAGLVVE